MKGEVCFKGMSQNPPLYTTLVSQGRQKVSLCGSSFHQPVVHMEKHLPNRERSVKMTSALKRERSAKITSALKRERSAKITSALKRERSAKITSALRPLVIFADLSHFWQMFLHVNHKLVK